MMHMTFYWGKKVTLLFDSWRTESWPAYALTLLACLLFSAFYQFLEDRRVKLNHLLAASRQLSSSSSASAAPLLHRHPKLSSSAILRCRAAVSLAGAALFGVNSAVGYLLMLAIMSFNGGVFIAVVIGLAVGHLMYRSGGGSGPVPAEVIVVDNNACACA